MTKQKPYLVLDVPLTAKIEGVAWSAGAGFSAGGLSAQATNIAWTFCGLANPEIAVIWMGLIAMGYTAHTTSEILASDLAARYGVTIREQRPPRWDVTKLNIF